MWITDIVGQAARRSMPVAPANTLGAPARVDVASGVRLHGSLTASGDLSVDGEIDGHIELPGHVLTLGTHARVTAPIAARRVHIGGEVVGDISATEAVVVESTGSVHGNIIAPAVSIADGARFAGTIDMRRHTPERSHVTRMTPREQIAV